MEKTENFYVEFYCSTVIKMGKNIKIIMDILDNNNVEIMELLKNKQEILIKILNAKVKNNYLNSFINLNKKIIFDNLETLRTIQNNSSSFMVECNDDINISNLLNSKVKLELCMYAFMEDNTIQCRCQLIKNHTDKYNYQNIFKKRDNIIIDKKPVEKDTVMNNILNIRKIRDKFNI